MARGQHPMNEESALTRHLGTTASWLRFFSMAAIKLPKETIK